jgi:hypothetical protein
MAKSVKYWGEFRSVADVHYRVEILMEEEVETPQRVYFPYDTPVEIEWSEVDKLEPVQGSSLTLQLVSESDRQFVDLYAIEVGTIRVDLYREGVLYWSGALDPELYEEPYSEKEDYDVTFTFSDFAILDRLKWSKTGVCSVQEVLDTCIASSGINHLSLESYISTYIREQGDMSLSDIYLLCDNFYDEDGEAMTMREVLDETLRPFALRMVQKGGRIYLYDLNAIHEDMPTEEVWWSDTDAVLGVDKVYNNVKVTFSPYADTELIDGTLEHDDVLQDATDGATFLMDNDWDNAAEGFTIYQGAQEELPLKLSNGATFFRLDEIYSGNDEAGVLWCYMRESKRTYDIAVQNVNNRFPRAFVQGSISTAPIITTERSFLGYISTTQLRAKYKLRINLDVLFDVRYNPFEQAANKNEEGNYNRMQDWCNFGYVPVMLYLKDAEGNILYHYTNKKLMESDAYKHDTSWCYWAEGAGNWGDMFLAYYDANDRKSASGFGGWAGNKMMLGYYRGTLPKKWEAMTDGEYIDLPPVGGFLELQVGRGIYQFDYKREEKDIYSIARWLMYRDPKVTLVNSNGTAIDTDDIEDTAWVNRAADEELEIDTVIGTLDGNAPYPSARGLVMRANLSAISRFTRAGVTARLEHLLIGTVYSQYATRHNTLSGTVRVLPDMRVLTDASTDGKYVVLSEVQDLMQDTSEIEMSEFVADNYNGVEYK